MEECYIKNFWDETLTLSCLAGLHMELYLFKFTILCLLSKIFEVHDANSIIANFANCYQGSSRCQLY